MPKASVIFKILMGIITATLLITVFLFTRTLYGYFGQPGSSSSFTTLRNLRTLPRQTGKLSISSVDSWMTFSYIERVFHLPADYIQKILPVADTRYPRLTIKKYATAHGLSVSSTLVNIKTALTLYPTTTLPTSSVWK